MKNMVKYYYIVDGHETRTFKVFTPLSLCQIDRVAYEFAKKEGISAEGVEIRRATGLPHDETYGDMKDTGKSNKFEKDWRV